MKNNFDSMTDLFGSLDDVEFIGETAKGKVKVVARSFLDNPYYIEKIEIDEDLIDPGNKDALQCFITNAANEALRKIDDKMVELYQQAIAKLDPYIKK